MIIIGMRSITYAMKAEQVLRGQGHRCEVVRNTASCGYALKVWGEADEIKEILRQAGISYGRITEGA